MVTIVTTILKSLVLRNLPMKVLEIHRDRRDHRDQNFGFLISCMDPQTLVPFLHFLAGKRVIFTLRWSRQLFIVVTIVVTNASKTPGSACFPWHKPQNAAFQANWSNCRGTMVIPWTCRMAPVALAQNEGLESACFFRAAYCAFIQDVLVLAVCKLALFRVFATFAAVPGITVIIHGMIG